MAKMDGNHQHIQSISTRVTFLTKSLLERLANKNCQVRWVAVTPFSYKLTITQDHTASFWSHDPESSHLSPVKFLIDFPLPTNRHKKLIFPNRAGGYIDLDMVVNRYPWRTLTIPSSMDPVHLEQRTQIPMNWFLSYIHSSGPSSLSLPASSSRNPLDTLPRIAQSGPLIGCLADHSSDRTDRFCLWWLQLQVNQDQLSLSEAFVKPQICPYEDLLPESASPEEKEKYNKERGQQLMDAFKRYPRLEFRLSLSVLFFLAAGIMPKSIWQHTDLHIRPMEGGLHRGMFAISELAHNHDDCVDCGSGKRQILIFVAKNGICLDLARGTVILDTAVLVTTKELRQILPKSFAEMKNKSPVPISTHKVMSHTMRTWEEALPAFAERCRGQAWEHGPACEYKKWQRVPVATVLQKDDPVFCSCSMGKLPKSWSVAEDHPIPQWNEIRPHLVRAAISLPFGCPGLTDPYHHPMSWDPLLHPRNVPVTDVIPGRGVVGAAAGSGPSAVATSAAGTNPTWPAPASTPSGVPTSATASAPTSASAPAASQTMAPTGPRPIASAKGILRPASTSAPVTASTDTRLTRAKTQAELLQEANPFQAQVARARTQALTQALAANTASLALRPKQPTTSSQTSLQAPAPVGTKSASTKPAVSYRCIFCNEAKNRDNGGDLNKCSKCKKAHYCSKACQVVDWKRHKKECNDGPGVGGSASAAENGEEKAKDNEKAKGDEKEKSEVRKMKDMAML
ncbi:unnamed protein product [Sordaria macrospora k-hell]|uniref:WGS project CABT00000000 data, contig 2.47 n=2 Tax=Sordaria macrospora TaxID=5147 RepID=F7W8W4_SORMK|nr:uncharacterized protein SMAC_07743 [Sordaria macrospora k-hell]CCC05087.1 unnamed protein product [Sordaria macrospora k-hell]